MRVLILGAGGRFRTEASIARALRSLGHTPRVVDVPAWRRHLRGLTGRALRWQVDQFDPDFILCTRHAAAAGPAVLEVILRRASSAFWYFDALSPLPEDIVALARLSDRTFVTYRFQLEAFRAAGCREMRFLPQGVDPALDRPARRAPASFRCDLSFVGSGQYPRRHALLHSLAAAFRLQIRGPGWGAAPADLPIAGGNVRGRKFARVVRGATLSLGIDALDHQRDPRSGGTSNRLWRVLGAEGCFLGEHVPGLDDFARHGMEALWYRTTAEAIDLARMHLADPDRAAVIAKAGRAGALARHTYAHRVGPLLAGQDYTSV